LLIIFILRGVPLIVQTAFRDGISFDLFLFGVITLRRVSLVQQSMKILHPGML